MFVYCYVHLSRPFEQIERRLVEILSGLDEFAAAAYREGEALRARVGVGGNGEPALAKRVRIRVGEPLRGDAVTIAPITWEATGAPGLFPKMEADVVLAALGPDLTQLSLRGSYEPPLGPIGRVLNRTIMHRVAEASVKGFLDRIAHTLEHDETSARNETTLEPVAEERR